MADMTVFTALHNVLWSGNNIQSFKTSAAVAAGQIVSFDAAGGDMTVYPCVNATGCLPIGVALYDAASGAYVAVALDGCIVYVVNNQSNALTGDAGDYCLADDCAGTAASNSAAGGFASPMAPAGSATYSAAGLSPLGIFLDDMAAGGTARVLINHPGGY